MNRLLQSSEDEHVTQLCIFGCSLEFFKGKCLFVCFETESCSSVQAGLELRILLLHPIE
jgi:hypothetical protein